MATSMELEDGIKMHEYKGKEKRIESAFWTVDKLTNFENVSVSHAVQFDDMERKQTIGSLCR